MVGRLKLRLLLLLAAALYIFRRPLARRVQAMLREWQDTEAPALRIAPGSVDDPSDLGKKGWRRALLRTKQALKDMPEFKYHTTT